MNEAAVFAKYRCPEDAGVSSKCLVRFLRESNKLKNKVQFHSMILLRHGKEVFRYNWQPYDDQTPHMLFSLSKSFTSAAAGFAVSEGLINWDTCVCDVLPEEVPDGRINELKQVTLISLLCMGSGLEESSDSPSPDPGITWARHVLSHKLVHAPFTHFHYNTFGTYLVSCMIQKVTGKTLTDYLYPRLFEPLGIEKPVWDMSPQGICCGGFGLHLSSDSIARFGQCLIQKGRWNGKQILPAGWVEFATKEHIANYNEERQDGNEWAQGYGLQFWRCMDGRYRGDGAFGQACIIDEKRDAVLAVTCATNDMGAEFKLIREFLFTAFDHGTGSEKDKEQLAAFSNALDYSLETSDDATLKPLPDGYYYADVNGTTFEISFIRFSYDIIRITICFGDGESNKMEFFLTKDKISLCAQDTNAMRRYFGGYSVRKGKLFVSIRSIDAPDTLEGCFTWTSKRVTFDGLGIMAFDGKTVFEKR